MLESECSELRCGKRFKGTIQGTDRGTRGSDNNDLVRLEDRCEKENERNGIRDQPWNEPGKGRSLRRYVKVAWLYICRS